MKFTEKQIFRMYRILLDTTKYPNTNTTLGDLTCSDRENLIRQIEDQQTNTILDIGAEQNFHFPQPATFIKKE